MDLAAQARLNHEASQIADWQGLKTEKWVQLRRYFPNPLVFRSHNFSKYSVHHNNDEGHDVQLLSLGHISTSVGTWDLGLLIGLSPLGYKLEVRGPSGTETSKENKKKECVYLSSSMGFPLATLNIRTGR